MEQNTDFMVKFDDEKKNIVTKPISTITTNLQADDLEMEMMEIEKAFNCINLKNSNIKNELNVEENKNLKIDSIKDNITSNSSYNKDSTESKNEENFCWVNKIKKMNTKSLPKIIHKIILEQVIDTKNNNAIIEKNQNKSSNQFKWIRGKHENILPEKKLYNNTTRYQNFISKKHYYNKENGRNNKVYEYGMQDKNPISKAKNQNIQYNRYSNDAKKRYYKNQSRRKYEKNEYTNVQKFDTKINNNGIDQYNNRDYNNHHTKIYSKKYNYSNKNSNEQHSKIVNYRNNPKHINNKTHNNSKRRQHYDSNISCCGPVKRLQRNRDTTTNTQKQIKVIKTKLFKEASKMLQLQAE